MGGFPYIWQVLFFFFWSVPMPFILQAAPHKQTALRKQLHASVFMLCFHSPAAQAKDHHDITKKIIQNFSVIMLEWTKWAQFTQVTRKKDLFSTKEMVPMTTVLRDSTSPNSTILCNPTPWGISGVYGELALWWWNEGGRIITASCVFQLPL